ncbi:molybdenum cofactor biosynthesis protein [Nannochloropsis oceanica]
MKSSLPTSRPPPKADAVGCDKQRVAESLLMSSCAGQFQHVVDDLREILPPSVLTKTFLQAVARAYHSQRGVIVTVAGAKVLLHKLGEVDEGYLDPKNKQILMVDARAEVVSTDNDNGKTLMTATSEPVRVELEQAVAHYVAANYATEAAACAVYAQEGALSVVIYGERLNFRNFWSGSWLSVWEIKEKALSGTIELCAHYFEGGNVQMRATKTVPTTPLPPTMDERTAAVAVVDAIQQAEETMQRGLETTYYLELDEIKRYSRHLILSQIGMQGQRKLKGGSVLCVGAGGLGSPLLLYLAAAGVGRLGIVDDDEVDVSNLQRQIIHGQSNVGEAKVRSAEHRIREVNPHVQVDMYEEKMTSENVLRILAPYDVVVDGTDNFPTRYLVNDACVILRKPLVYGAILRFEGQASVFNYQGGPNYRDLLPVPPAPGDVPSCAEGGVLGVLPGIIGCIQATETLKLLTGVGKPLSGRILIYNALDMTFREVGLQPDPNTPKITSLIDYDCFCSSGSGTQRHQMQQGLSEPVFKRVSVKEARRKFEEDGWAPFVLDVRLPQEAEIATLPFSDLLCPHREVERVAAQLPRDQDILVYCKVGGRSAQACQKLAALGFPNVVNLDGGIIAWAQEIDARLPVY